MKPLATKKMAQLATGHCNKALPTAPHSEMASTSHVVFLQKRLQLTRIDEGCLPRLRSLKNLLVVREVHQQLVLAGQGGAMREAHFIFLERSNGPVEGIKVVLDLPGRHRDLAFALAQLYRVPRIVVPPHCLSGPRPT